MLSMIYRINDMNPGMNPASSLREASAVSGERSNLPYQPHPEAEPMNWLQPRLYTYYNPRLRAQGEWLQRVGE